MLARASLYLDQPQLHVLGMRGRAFWRDFVDARGLFDIAGKLRLLPARVSLNCW